MFKNEIVEDFYKTLAESFFKSGRICGINEDIIRNTYEQIKNKINEGFSLVDSACDEFAKNILAKQSVDILYEKIPEGLDLMFNGKKAICGGTTANLVSRESRRPIVNMPVMNMGSLPPISKMDGVDLITEGILTLTRTLEYLEQEKLNEQDAAGELVKFLLDCDMIEFMVGAMLNQAHYDPSLPIEIEIRRNVIKKIKRVLEDNYFKSVNINYV